MPKISKRIMSFVLIVTLALATSFSISANN